MPSETFEFLAPGCFDSLAFTEKWASFYALLLSWPRIQLSVKHGLQTDKGYEIDIKDRGYYMLGHAKHASGYQMRR